MKQRMLGVVVEGNHLRAGSMDELPPSAGEIPQVHRALAFTFKYKKGPSGGAVASSEAKAAKAAFDHLRRRGTINERVVMDYWLPQWRSNREMHGKWVDHHAYFRAYRQGSV